MDISLFPKIKVSGAIQGQTSGKCYICADALKERGCTYFTSKRHKQTK